MKLFYFDLETTGVRHWRNGIHQIAGAIEINGEVVEHFNFKVQPYYLATIEDEALKIAGITREDLDGYEPMTSVYRKLCAMLGKYVNKYDKKDKFHLVGYNNASFDNQFLRAFFVQNGDEYFGSWFWSSSIDVMVLAAQALMPQRHEMPNFKLHTVAAAFGHSVTEDKLHDALYDIELTRNIYHSILKAKP